MRYLFLLLLSMCCGCANLSDFLKYENTTIETGYMRGEIKGDDLHAIPVIVRPNWNINRLVRLNPKYGYLGFGTETFAYSLIEPETGVLIGAIPTIRYSYPIYEGLSAYIEGGAGPAYISIDTYEQEESGFSFLDQVGAGAAYRFSDLFSARVGYRFGHLSHGGVLNTRNRGIETHTITFGLQLWFP